jgi:hypothetical protein
VRSRCDDDDDGCGDFLDGAGRLETAWAHGTGPAAAPPGRRRALTLLLDRGDVDGPTGSPDPLRGLRTIGGAFRAPAGEDAPLALRVVVDRALVEAFADGRAAATAFAPRLASRYDPTRTGIRIFSTCPGVRGNATVWEMRSAPTTTPF